MNADPQRLARVLGHDFRRRELLHQALTHRSAGPNNNERLEFVGDALIGLVVGEALLGRFGSADEGSLSRMRASLVNRDALAGLAKGLGLGEFLHLGAGELRTGGHTRSSILADALEAVLGAVYLDAGFEVARTVALGLFAEPLGRIDAERVGKDPKTRLQEWLQSRGRPLPEYSIVAVEGSQHAQRFRVGCRIPDDKCFAGGQGTSRRRAEQAAAEAMLDQIESRA